MIFSAVEASKVHWTWGQKTRMNPNSITYSAMTLVSHVLLLKSSLFSSKMVVIRLIIEN